MQKLRVVFFGTPEFSVASLNCCHENAQLIAVVSGPDEPRGRKQQLQAAAVAARAQELKLPCFKPRSLRKPDADDGLYEFLEKNPADLFVVVAYGKLLPKNLLESARLGPVNLHGSLLPRWRGAAPIQRAIEAGDSETGICLQRMVDKLDAGDVISQRKIPIEDQTDAIALFDRMSKEGAELLAESLEQIQASQNLDGTQQDESKVTHAAKIDRHEGSFNPEWTAAQCQRKVRAFRVWPGVRACVVDENGQNIEKLSPLKICKSKISQNSAEIRPGEILISGKSAILGLKDSALELLEIQIPGKIAAPAFQVLGNFVENKGKAKLALKAPGQ